MEINKTNDFINKATEKHGNKYDYSLVNYIKQNDKIKMEYCQNNNIPLIIIKYDDNILIN